MRNYGRIFVGGTDGGAAVLRRNAQRTGVTAAPKMWIDYTIRSVNFLTIIYGFDKRPHGAGPPGVLPGGGAFHWRRAVGGGIFPVDKREKRDMIKR